MRTLGPFFGEQPGHLSPECSEVSHQVGFMLPEEGDTRQTGTHRDRAPC